MPKITQSLKRETTTNKPNVGVPLGSVTSCRSGSDSSDLVLRVYKRFSQSKPICLSGEERSHPADSCLSDVVVLKGLEKSTCMLFKQLFKWNKHDTNTVNPECTTAHLKQHILTESSDLNPLQPSQFTSESSLIAVKDPSGRAPA